MTICSRTKGYCFQENRLLFFLLFCNLKIPKQGIRMQIFFPNGLQRLLKNGHLPVKLHSSSKHEARHFLHVCEKFSRNSGDCTTFKGIFDLKFDRKAPHWYKDIILVLNKTFAIETLSDQINSCFFNFLFIHIASHVTLASSSFAKAQGKS